LSFGTSIERVQFDKVLSAVAADLAIKVPSNGNGVRLATCPSRAECGVYATRSGNLRAHIKWNPTAPIADIS
jgi:hypothetical protein